MPTHPDRAAGLGFLGGSAAAFMPLLLSQGALLAGLIANHIFYQGKTLLDFKPEIVAAVVFFIVACTRAFVRVRSRLAQAKRQGLLEYGALANRYVNEFDQKWLRGGAPRVKNRSSVAEIFNPERSDGQLANQFTRCDHFRSVKPLYCKPLLLGWCLRCH